MYENDYNMNLVFKYHDIAYHQNCNINIRSQKRRTCFIWNRWLFIVALLLVVDSVLPLILSTSHLYYCFFCRFTSCDDPMIISSPEIFRHMWTHIIYFNLGWRGLSSLIIVSHHIPMHITENCNETILRQRICLKWLRFKSVNHSVFAW